jgi:hypothetical protein
MAFSEFKSAGGPPTYPSGKQAQFDTYEKVYLNADDEYARGPGMYRLDSYRVKPVHDCHQYIPGLAQQNASSHGVNLDSVPIESELKNLTRIHSRAPQYKTHPGDFKKLVHAHEAKKIDAMRKPVCENQIIPEQARPFGRATNIPGAFVNRFEPLCFDPQNPDTIHSNWYQGQDTRNDTKDVMSHYKFYPLKNMSISQKQKGLQSVQKEIADLPGNPENTTKGGSPVRYTDRRRSQPFTGIL